jgi:hypothetical protein
VTGICPNVPLSSGHRVIDITNGHFIHASPLEGTGVSTTVTGMWMYDVLGDFIHIMKGPCGCCGMNGTVKALSSLRGLPMQPPFTMDTRKIP